MSFELTLKTISIGGWIADGEVASFKQQVGSNGRRVHRTLCGQQVFGTWLTTGWTKPISLLGFAANAYFIVLLVINGEQHTHFEPAAGGDGKLHGSTL